jgi:alpha-glucosidase
VSTADTRWWRDAAIYQIYPRSFADDNGDGVGDLAGVRARLGYLRDLGVDAIWFSPWFPSPMADAGYDVADYRDIDPSFGTLDEATALIAEAHALDIRIIIDIVPNHTSVAHAWFQRALVDPSYRDRFWFRDGRGDLPPNDWGSIFGGPAWTQVADGQWYLHMFDAGQPDFNWDNPVVREEFEDVLRFWFDRGVDGIRIDSAAMVVKDPLLPDFDPASPPDPHPWNDRDEIHDVYRGWRRIADSYPGGRALIGEVWLADQQRFALYLRPDELHAAFNFDFLGCAWDAAALRESIDGTLSAHAPVNAPATWVLSNHDVTRHATRYGRLDSTGGGVSDEARVGPDTPVDPALGLRRARAATLLLLALPGSAYVYQGDELGLPEVVDLPEDVLADPIWERSGHRVRGRDGCRVPIPWTRTGPSLGFGAGGPWLPQPDSWTDLSVEAQQGVAGSVLELYRTALGLRREHLTGGDLEWLEGPAGTLLFRRSGGGSSVFCAVNLGDGPADLPAYDKVLVSSEPLVKGRLPHDAAAWLV